MIRFVISDQLDELSYEVRVYPNRRAYLAACRRRRPDEKHGTSRATTFCERTIEIHADGSESLMPFCGAIYLDASFVDGEIITHEAIHAALQLYRRRHRGIASFGRNLTMAEHVREEELALSAGRLAQAIADELWNHRVWRRSSRRST